MHLTYPYRSYEVKYEDRNRYFSKQIVGLLKSSYKIVALKMPPPPPQKKKKKKKFLNFDIKWA